MFKSMNKYYEINFDKIVEMREMIIKENIEITCVNSNSISIIIPGTSIDSLIEENNAKNNLLKDAKYYISSFSSKFFNLGNPETNTNTVVDGMDANKYDEYGYFYHIYKNCMPFYDKLKSANDNLLNKIINEKTNNRLYVLKPYLDELKLEAKAPKVTNEIAIDIERLLTGLGMIARLDFIRYLKYIKSSKKNVSEKFNVETENLIVHIISSIVSYLEKDYVFRDIFDKLDMLNDANILSHSNRVCILMIEFLYYYNNVFNKVLSNMLRQDYKNIYLEQYRKILSHYNVVTTIEKLENVFKLGIRKFTSSEIVNYSIGAFYHDTTMLNMMDFVPTDEFIKDGDFKDFHTAKSYYFLKYVLNQKDEASLMAGLHHECYGYGSSILKNFMNKKINDPKYKLEFLMTFEPDDIINAEALAYFPAKMLEVADIYDSLTFMGGSRNENPHEVIMFMKENFIEDKIKIDPIIFNLFIQFLSDTKGIQLHDTF